MIQNNKVHMAQFALVGCYILILTLDYIGDYPHVRRHFRQFTRDYVDDFVSLSVRSRQGRFSNSESIYVLPMPR